MMLKDAVYFSEENEKKLLTVDNAFRNSTAAVLIPGKGTDITTLDLPQSIRVIKYQLHTQEVV